MLVLSRKVGQKIVIPGLDAEIAVVAIKGQAVRIGITAPEEVVIRRAEVAGGKIAAGVIPGGPAAPPRNPMFE